jgi:hypothetical protein
MSLDLQREDEDKIALQPTVAEHLEKEVCKIKPSRNTSDEIGA